MNTQEMIEALSREQGKGQSGLGNPFRRGMVLLCGMLAYAVVLGAFLGVREDILTQLQRPFFVAEIAMLLALTASAIVAAVLAMYPDAYQKPELLKLPYLLLLILFVLLVLQLFMPADGLAVFPIEETHDFECTLCIAASALLPSLGMFLQLRRGASIRPLDAGAFAVLAATAISLCVLRMAEANDNPLHLWIWHYLPTLGFAILGAFLGKKILKW